MELHFFQGSIVYDVYSWWRHQMEAFSVLLALCEGGPPVTSGFPLTKATDA